MHRGAPTDAGTSLGAQPGSARDFWMRKLRLLGPGQTRIDTGAHLKPSALSTRSRLHVSPGTVIQTTMRFLVEPVKVRL